MPKKKHGDLLGPRGDDSGADYIRMRLRRRVELERGITMRPSGIERLLRCLDDAATLDRIQELHQEAEREILAPVWTLEVEPILAEMHGAWRYEGRPEVLKRDLERAAHHYAVSHAMDSLLAQCGFPTVRNRGERLDDAAWFSVPPKERG